eukprot:1078197_1
MTSLQRKHREEAKNILRGFNAAHIQYKIIWSRPSLNEQESKYVYVMMWMDATYTEEKGDVASDDDSKQASPNQNNQVTKAKTRQHICPLNLKPYFRTLL